MGIPVETLMAASGLSGSIQSCDGATIRDGKLAGFKLVSQRALGLKNGLVNVYAVAGRCIGFITDADVAAFVGGDAGGFTPEGGWRVKWSSQLVDLLGLRGTAADQAHEAQETSRALAERYPNKGSMPPEVVRRLYHVREMEVHRLSLQGVIRPSDLTTLDRGSRIAVASLLYGKCDAAAREALLNDSHAHVRSCAVLSQSEVDEAATATSD